MDEEAQIGHQRQVEMSRMNSHNKYHFEKEAGSRPGLLKSKSAPVSPHNLPSSSGPVDIEHYNPIHCHGSHSDEETDVPQYNRNKNKRKDNKFYHNLAHLSKGNLKNDDISAGYVDESHPPYKGQNEYLKPSNSSGKSQKSNSPMSRKLSIAEERLQVLEEQQAFYEQFSLPEELEEEEDAHIEDLSVIRSQQSSDSNTTSAPSGSGGLLSLGGMRRSTSNQSLSSNVSGGSRGSGRTPRSPTRNSRLPLNMASGASVASSNSGGGGGQDSQHSGSALNASVGSGGGGGVLRNTSSAALNTISEGEDSSRSTTTKRSSSDAKRVTYAFNDST